MTTLKEIIHQAHSLAQNLENGKPITNINVEQSREYRKEHSNEHSLTLDYHPDSHHLQRVSVSIVDKTQSGVFTKEELLQIANFVDDPSFLSVSHMPQGPIRIESEDSNESEITVPVEFELSVRQYGPIGKISWKSEQYPVVSSRNRENISYGELASMFGLPAIAGLNPRVFPYKIDKNHAVAGIHSLFLEGYNVDMDIGGKTEGERHVYFQVSLKEGVIENGLVVEYELPSKDAVVAPINDDVFASLETIFSFYRGTDITTLPWALWDYTVMEKRHKFSTYNDAWQHGTNLVEKLENIIDHIGKEPVTYMRMVEIPLT